MKELEVTLRVRNNRLKERRLALGMGQRLFAAAVGMSFSAYHGLETLRCSPRTTAGEWKPVAILLATFHCVEPEELFPGAVLAVDTPVAVRRLDAADLKPLLSEHHQRLLAGPDAAHDRAELRDQIESLLATLTPRQREVLQLRCGLDGGEQRTLAEVGRDLDLTQERIRQIEAKALRRLRYPSLAKRLRDFWIEES